MTDSDHGAAGRVHEAVEEQARRTPHRLAVVSATARLTYASLDGLAGAIAGELRRGNVRPGDAVGVRLPRDVALIAALLGVWKAGAAYVPMDPAYPASRLDYMASDAAVTRIVDTGLVAAATADLGRADLDRPSGPGDGTDVAYIMYTSGSTGRPKGVVVEHRNVLASLRWELSAYSDEEAAGGLATASVSFDMSVAEMFGPLIRGGTVIIADNLLSLPAHPARDMVTMLTGTPSVLALLVRDPLPPGVRTVRSGAERLSRALADQIYANPGVRRLVNWYGPTETTIGCVACDVARDGDADPPIGASYAGSVLSVRDDTGQPVRDGEAGELWVAGPLVARGYLGLPELTAARFVTDEDGTRHYRTGDIVRRERGLIEYVGRDDEQVKVRGYRIELGEVEAVLAGHPLVARAVALAPAGPDGTRRLTGFVEPSAAAGQAGVPLTEAGLRQWLADRVPSHLVPSRIAVLAALPVGPSGKTDRNLLAGYEFGRDAATRYVAPRDDAERRIALIVADALELAEVGVHDLFADLGGHSLAAARVCAQVNAEFSADVTIAEFYAGPTVAEFALLARTRRGAAGRRTGPVRQHGRDVFPLTAAQQDMWLLRTLNSAPLATTVAFRLGLTGSVRAGALRAALGAIVRRHEVLRSTVADLGPEAGARRWACLVQDPSPVAVAEHDLRAVPEAERPARTADLVRAAAQRPFDLSADTPVLRATLIRLGPDTAELLLVTDHLACDGWSVAVVMAELLAELCGESPAEPRLQIGDVAVFEQSAAAATRREDVLSGWRRELTGAMPPYEVAASPGHGPARLLASRVTRQVSRDTTAAVRELAARCGASPFGVYLTALGAVVSALTDRSDLIIGAAVADRANPDLAAVVGSLVHILPLRLDMAGHVPFGAALTASAATAVRALDLQGVSGSEALDAAGIDRPRGTAACPVVLSFQPEIPVRLERGGIGIQWLGEVGCGGTQATLTLFVAETAGGTDVQLEYDTAQYGAADAERFLDRVLGVLRAAAADPGRPLASFELVDDQEKAALLSAGTGAALPDDRPATVVEAIMAYAARHPAAVATTDAEGQLSYGELADWSARVAAAVRAMTPGQEPDITVGICLARDRFLPATLLGVMRAGAAYVPLEPDQPAERLRWQLRDARTTVVIAAGQTVPLARDLAESTGARVVDLGLLTGGGGRMGEGGTRVDPGGLAYVLYTSGSTGRPKGVEVTHASLAAFVAAMRVTPGVRPDDVMLCLTALSFDVAGFELWVGLACGLRLAVIDRDSAVDGHEVARFIADNGVTLMTATPTTLRMLDAAGWPGDPRLRVVSIGEVLDPVLAEKVAARVGDLWNAYGPTETTIYSTMWRVTLPLGATVPIGRPLPGESVSVRDTAGRVLPRGAVGELWIGGAGVAAGYRDRPEATSAVFVSDPARPGTRCYRTGDLARWRPDDTLEFAGRRDGQVKLRGHRIELGEIEAVLREIPGLADAVVVVHGEGPGARLVGYIVAASPPELGPPELGRPELRPVDGGALERQLRARLPGYMVPRQWVALGALPLTASGKLDRGALPRPELAGPRVAVAPRSETELLVAGIWAAVLGVGDVGVHDDFFALGGHSLAATLVVSHLEEALSFPVPARLLFDRPVLAEFAVGLEDLLASGLGTPPASGEPRDAASASERVPAGQRLPAGERIAPSTEAELLVAEIWGRLLGVPDPGANEDFFALGGDSLAATRVVGRLMDMLDLRVPVRLLFERPTLAGFAEGLEQLLAADAEDGRE